MAAMVTSCRSWLVKRSAKARRPGADADSLMTSSLSGYETKASRAIVAPPAVNTVRATAVTRSSSRRYPVTCSGAIPGASMNRSPSGAYRLRELALDPPCQRVGGFVVASEERLADLGQPVDGVRVHGRVDRPAGPQRRVVQQEPIGCGPAEYHRPRPPVPEGQGFLEGGGGGVVPQPRWRDDLERCPLARDSRDAGRRGERRGRGQRECEQVT